MKTPKLAVLAACACLAAPLAGADCAYPQKPAQLPDGNTASLEEMVAGQKAVRQFDADVTSFTKCLDEAAAKELTDPNLTEEALFEYCRANFTNYKRPKHIEFRTELPKTPVGKILRRELRK